MSTMTTTSDTDENLPAHLRGQDIEGAEDLGEYIIPPRLKVVQPLSKAPYDALDKGTVCLTPSADIVAEFEEEFTLVPLLFWTEWIRWGHLTNPQGIIEISRDAKSSIAVWSRDPDTREQPNESGFGKPDRCVEHLNFLFKITSGPHDGVVAVMSFSKAEHSSGRRFITTLHRRSAPIYGCQFVASGEKRSNDKGTWYGLEIANPADRDLMWVDEAQFEANKAEHAYFKDLRDKIQVDHADDDESSDNEAKTEFE